MITAIDTNILFDVFLPDPKYEESSRLIIEQSSRLGRLVVCEAVYAELSAWFSSEAELDEILADIGITVEPISRAGAFAAGRAWKKYRQGGGSRSRIMTDFVIGGHALRQADQFLSRDRGFYRQYFHGLKIVESREA